jgi:putative DNA-invertase from lambdoid prophage Rac
MNQTGHRSVTMVRRYIRDGSLFRDNAAEGIASGRALAGMLAVFAEFERDILRDRVKAGIAQARKEGRPHGRPVTAGLHLQVVKKLFRKGVSKREIAKQVGISRTSVRRLLAPA